MNNYLEATIYSLLSCDLLNNYFINQNWKKDYTANVKRCYKDETLSQLTIYNRCINSFIYKFIVLVYKYHHENSLKKIDFSYFDNTEVLMSWVNLWTSVYVSNDVNEFLNYIIERIHEYIEYNVNFTYSNIPEENKDLFERSKSKYYDLFTRSKKDNLNMEKWSMIYNIFCFQVIYQPNNSFINKTRLQLSIKDDDVTLSSIMNDNLNNQHLFLWSLPQILIVVIRRFSGNTKKMNNISIPLLIDVARFKHVAYPQLNTQYMLISVIYHLGTTFKNTENYVDYCTINKINDKWISTGSLKLPTKIDDFKNIDNATPYVMFYKKII
jgi:hypothetical protein